MSATPFRIHAVSYAPGECGLFCTVTPRRFMSYHVRPAKSVSQLFLGHTVKAFLSGIWRFFPLRIELAINWPLIQLKNLKSMQRVHRRTEDCRPHGCAGTMEGDLTRCLVFAVVSSLSHCALTSSPLASALLSSHIASSYCFLHSPSILCVTMLFLVAGHPPTSFRPVEHASAYSMIIEVAGCGNEKL
ncbi:hypothetical protein AcW1_001049 [Taiwanofungus camphoratus]|nr:hypothetical protein AcW1_001049 [Antrodia cinnamomea]